MWQVTSPSYHPMQISKHRALVMWQVGNGPLAILTLTILACFGYTYCGYTY